MADRGRQHGKARGQRSEGRQRPVSLSAERETSYPFENLRVFDATVMLYNMDKGAGAPTSGLVIGREEAMVSVRRAMGIQSERFGAPSAHGKAAHVAADPGKLALATLLQALRVIRDDPEKLTKPIDLTHQIVLDEYASFRGRLGEGIRISKSYNLGGVEINYESTWGCTGVGIPIFSNEDRVAGSHILGQCMAKMGVLLSQAEDANIIVTPGLGTVDPQIGLWVDSFL